MEKHAQILVDNDVHQPSEGLVASQLNPEICEVSQKPDYILLLNTITAVHHCFQYEIILLAPASDNHDVDGHHNQRQ